MTYSTETTMVMQDTIKMCQGFFGTEPFSRADLKNAFISIGYIDTNDHNDNPMVTRNGRYLGTLSTICSYLDVDHTEPIQGSKGLYLGDQKIDRKNLESLPAAVLPFLEERTAQYGKRNFYVATSDKLTERKARIKAYNDERVTNLKRKIEMCKQDIAALEKQTAAL